MATIYKRGKSWYLDWREDGKRQKESLGPCTAVEARVALNAKEIELSTGENPLLSVTDISLPDITPEVEEWYKVQHPASYDRVQIFHDHLISHFETTPVSQITTVDVTRYQAKRQQQVGIATINKEVRHLNKVLNMAVEWKLIHNNPLTDKKITLERADDKPPRFFTKQELQLIYTYHPKSAPYWQIMAGTGLRRKEAMNLRWCDVTDSELQVLSTQQRRNKTGKWRQIPLSPNVKAALDSLPHDTEYVFPQMDHRNFSRKFERLLEKIHIKEASLHTLRHTFCSHLAMNGVPLRTIQVMAGHSSFRTTERYAHLAPQHLQNAVSNLDI